ncbi:hypothetical protein N5H80_000329 [Salmonella enterica]|nr:hypothetical protein [Salmonella enterica subsp. diarizonae]EIE5007934.1 hypothetical protein [Salmonella enterica]EJU7195623.1 hypothetical protein [Salmonella enterica]SQI66480.1 Uncharacterised protein [Salmonella enterica subsp. diarizonae]
MKLGPYTLPLITLSTRANYHNRISAGNTVSDNVVEGSKGHGALTDSTLIGS